MTHDHELVISNLKMFGNRYNFIYSLIENHIVKVLLRYCISVLNLERTKRLEM